MRTIFISIDTVAADRVSALGSRRVCTPNLDRFAADGALFTEAYASDIPTQPSHTALFTGRFGINTGIVSHFHPPAALHPDSVWLPSVFRAKGFRTGAVDHLFSMKEWFIRGYDDYIVPPGRSRSPGSVINDLAQGWLDRHREEDFFLFLHFWDAHIPYVPPEPYKSMYTSALRERVDPQVWHKLQARPTYPLAKRNLYEYLEELPSLEYIEALHYAEIAYLDAELGRLFNHLEEVGILDDSLVVVFGDHGEVMTEHDAWFDHAGLYDSVVHVPLIIRAPGLVPATRIDAMVSLADVLPTILELHGFDDVSERNGFDGVSLLPLIKGVASSHRSMVFLSECTWAAHRAVRTRDFKYIRCWDPGIFSRAEAELYDLRSDPGEQRNLIHEVPGVAAELEDLLMSWVERGLAGRPDPLLEVIDYGRPGPERLKKIIGEDAGRATPGSVELIRAEQPGPRPLAGSSPGRNA